jgi:hypothetical protein
METLSLQSYNGLYFFIYGYLKTRSVSQDYVAVKLLKNNEYENICSETVITYWEVHLPWMTEENHDNP